MKTLRFDLLVLGGFQYPTRVCQRMDIIGWSLLGVQRRISSTRYNLAHRCISKNDVAMVEMGICTNTPTLSGV